MWNKLKGYKSYTIAVLGVLYVVIGLILGKVTGAQAIDLIFGSAALAAVRSAIG